jgi:hypothetical protein
LEVIWVSLKGRSVYSDPEENFLLNTYVLLRRERIIATPDPFFKSNFAQGLAKVKCGESLLTVVNINHKLSTYPAHVLNSITKHRSRGKNKKFHRFW